MDAPDTRIDHVGIAVESIDDAEGLLLALGAEKVHEETTDETFTWATYRLGDASRFELLEPVPGTDSFLTGFLERYGPGPHHVTLEVAAIDPLVDRLESAGFRVVEYHEHDDWIEAFVAPGEGNPTGTLLQLMEYHDSYARRRETDADGLFVRGDPL
ncbi:VOC family protein [Natrononativus amylolyticus]|uniref:VOC family protein n=1 Tax=Natrononativus amylolyticus TaxID=2963434 RepID=UPI0020CFE6E3|nr:VOC family protein [Natrononativus amylolyticus]